MTNTMYQKLELLKISDTYEDFRIGNSSNKILIDDLLKLLLHIINRKDLNELELEELTNKIIVFLNNLVIDDDKLKNLKISKNISNVKNEIIKKIKTYTKEERKDNELVNVYKNVTNELEKIEIALLVDKVTPTNLTNYNIINYLIFDEKLLSRSIFLIEHYPYFVNIYNITGNKILTEIVEKIIAIINSDGKKIITNKQDLFYYDNVLTSLLNTEKISFSQEELEYVVNLLTKEEEKTTNKQKQVWFNYFINIILSDKYKLDKKTINDMYNIRKQNDHRLEYDDFRSLYATNKLRIGNIITIDSEDTIDRDDALEVKQKKNGNYVLRIIIADPNSVYDMDSKIMKDALKQGESIYYKKETYHMFPENIVTNLLSLDERKRRWARVYRYEIDKFGNIVDFKITKEIVYTKNNLSYNQVDNIIKHNSGSKDLENTIGNLLELSNIISKKYEGIDLSEECQSKECSSSSELLISTFMMFNNHQVSKYFKDNNLPFIYRAHILHKELDNLNIHLQSLTEREKLEYQKMIKKLEGINLTSFYTTTPISHDAMNLECYGFTTAPMRRSADILSNDCQDKFYFSNLSDKELYKYEEELKHQVKLLNDRKLEIEEHYKKLSRR